MELKVHIRTRMWLVAHDGMMLRIERLAECLENLLIHALDRWCPPVLPLDGLASLCIYDNAGLNNPFARIMSVGQPDADSLSVIIRTVVVSDYKDFWRRVLLHVPIPGSGKVCSPDLIGREKGMQHFAVEACLPNLNEARHILEFARFSVRRHRSKCDQKWGESGMIERGGEH
jgi:hypothetical protein